MQYLWLVWLHLFMSHVNGQINHYTARLLEEHNKYRSWIAQRMIEEEPQASNMNELKWDQGLAGIAQDYSTNCYFEHNVSPEYDLMNNYKNISEFIFDEYNLFIGENLYFSTASETLSTLVKGIEKWFMQYENYNYLNNSCNQGDKCDHYRQLIWAKTRYIGCGYTMCDNLYDKSGKTWNNAVFLVCNYFPAGYWKNESPYEIGSECDSCDFDRNECNSGLCSGCLSPLWSYCKHDYYSNCNDFKHLCYDNDNNNIINGCRNTCNQCTNDSLYCDFIDDIGNNNSTFISTDSIKKNITTLLHTTNSTYSKNGTKKEMLTTTSTPTTIATANRVVNMNGSHSVSFLYISTHGRNECAIEYMNTDDIASFIETKYDVIVVNVNRIHSTQIENQFIVVLIPFATNFSLNLNLNFNQSLLILSIKQGLNFYFEQQCSNLTNAITTFANSDIDKDYVNGSVSATEPPTSATSSVAFATTFDALMTETIKNSISDKMDNISVVDMNSSNSSMWIDNQLKKLVTIEIPLVNVEFKIDGYLLIIFVILFVLVVSWLICVMGLCYTNVLCFRQCFNKCCHCCHCCHCCKCCHCIEHCIERCIKQCCISSQDNESEVGNDDERIKSATNENDNCNTNENQTFLPVNGHKQKEKSRKKKNKKQKKENANEHENGNRIRKNVGHRSVPSESTIPIINMDVPIETNHETNHETRELNTLNDIDELNESKESNPSNLKTGNRRNKNIINGRCHSQEQLQLQLNNEDEINISVTGSGNKSGNASGNGAMNSNTRRNTNGNETMSVSMSVETVSLKQFSKDIILIPPKVSMAKLRHKPGIYVHKESANQTSNKTRRRNEMNETNKDVIDKKKETNITISRSGQKRKNATRHNATRVTRVTRVEPMQPTHPSMQQLYKVAVVTPIDTPLEGRMDGPIIAPIESSVEGFSSASNEESMHMPFGVFESQVFEPPHDHDQSFQDSRRVHSGQEMRTSGRTRQLSRPRSLSPVQSDAYDRSRQSNKQYSQDDSFRVVRFQSTPSPFSSTSHDYYHKKRRRNSRNRVNRHDRHNGHNTHKTYHGYNGHMKHDDFVANNYKINDFDQLREMNQKVFGYHDNDKNNFNENYNDDTLGYNNRNHNRDTSQHGNRNNENNGNSNIYDNYSRYRGHTIGNTVGHDQHQSLQQTTPKIEKIGDMVKRRRRQEQQWKQHRQQESNDSIDKAANRMARGVVLRMDKNLNVPTMWTQNQNPSVLSSDVHTCDLDDSVGSHDDHHDAHIDVNIPFIEKR